jgi:ribosomal protein S18 acetylase RimI-like enzyme
MSQTLQVQIRAARPNDLTTLQDIERSAGTPFRDIGMPEIADDEPPSKDELAHFLHHGHAWVATTSTQSDLPIAYLFAEPLDGDLHIEQVSVHQDHARQGLGRALIEHAATTAAAQGMAALTLTTFRDVAWNAPYYRRLGFRELSDQELTPELREIRRHEAMRGLDRWPRICMRRNLSPDVPPPATPSRPVPSRNPTQPPGSPSA